MTIGSWYVIWSSKERKVAQHYVKQYKNLVDIKEKTQTPIKATLSPSNPNTSTLPVIKDPLYIEKIHLDYLEDTLFVYNYMEQCNKNLSRDVIAHK
jgi:hypothetical protein